MVWREVKWSLISLQVEELAFLYLLAGRHAPWCYVSPPTESLTSIRS